MEVKPMRLEILTPTQVVVKSKAKYVIIPSDVGELGIFEGHSPLVTKLKSGVLSYQVGSVMHKVAVHFGYAEIRENQIYILADQAEKPDEIDLEKARKDQEEAENELKGIFNAEEMKVKAIETHKKLMRAKTRQEIFTANPAPM